MTSGKITQVLNSYKQKVGTLTSESGSLGEEIQSRRDMLERIDTETDAVTKVRLPRHGCHGNLRTYRRGREQKK